MRSKLQLSAFALALCATVPAALAASQAPNQDGARDAAVQEAGSKRLSIGSAAPGLDIASWVKGRPVESFEPGKIYVIEFWATWCGPCLESIPHLTHLAKQYQDKGVSIIGVTTEDERNRLEQVEQLVESRGAGMGYTVAFDQQSNTKNAWMKASGQNGIPACYLVDEGGQIAWIGHPMYLDEPLARVVAGTWDPVSGQERIKQAAASHDRIASAMAQDPAAALVAIEEFRAEYPLLESVVREIEFEANLKAGNYEQASKVGQQMLRFAVEAKDPMGLNNLAWLIVDPASKLDKRDLDLALEAAKAANALSGEKDPAILDTLARVHFWAGDLDRALELQKKAHELADGPMKGEIGRSLEEYRKAVEAKSAAR